MSARFGAAVIMVVAVGIQSAPAQEEPVIKVTGLTDKLYMLTTDQGAYTTNSLVFTGADGILLVDTQSTAEAAELKRVVDSFDNGNPRYIINTHRHVEHIGGNAAFGSEPVVIAHHLVPEKLRSGSYVFDEFPDATFPDITVRGSMSIYFNDERIDIHELSGGHDDNEIIVHFTASKYVHLSSLVNGFNFPSVDSDGSPLQFAELIGRAMEILPEDVTIISGHNDPGPFSAMKPYRDMIIGTERAVREGVKQGKNLETLQQEKVLADWERYAGSYVSTAEWTRYLYDAITEKKDARQTVYVPVYEVWKKSSGAKALERYRELKADDSGRYRTGEFTLLVIGDKMLGRGYTDDAALFLEASLEEYPESRYSYYAAYKLATIHMDRGATGKAITYCKRALELNPDMQEAQDLMAELQEK